MTSGQRPLGREQLSLSLIDVRNHTLALLGALEGALARDVAQSLQCDRLPPPLWILGHCAWFQEYWIARNPMRHLGRACADAPVRPPSIVARSDEWWDDRRQPQQEGTYGDLASIAEIRSYLLDTLEQTLALLDDASDDDAGLHFFRLSLLHEERHAEQLLEVAQVLGWSINHEWPAVASPRAPILVPATRWQLGIDPGLSGLSLDHERPAHEVSVPEFEIDAQGVTWAQYIEFVEDSAYERPELWHPHGWAWLQAGLGADGAAGAEAIRAPRFVEQLAAAAGAVLQRRFGQLVRLRGDQPVTHVSWWEADAWCRWAGRRLPAEVEWDLAAHRLSGRGFRWGEVLEWTGTSARPYPGFIADAAQTDPLPVGGLHRVLRGACALSRPELRRASMRRFAKPGTTHHFSGFRSCAV